MAIFYWNYYTSLFVKNTCFSRQVHIFVLPKLEVCLSYYNCTKLPNRHTHNLDLAREANYLHCYLFELPCISQEIYLQNLQTFLADATSTNFTSIFQLNFRKSLLPKFWLVFLAYKHKQISKGHDFVLWMWTWGFKFKDCFKFNMLQINNLALLQLQKTSFWVMSCGQCQNSIVFTAVTARRQDIEFLNSAKISKNTFKYHLNTLNSICKLKKKKTWNTKNNFIKFNQ